MMIFVKLMLLLAANVLGFIAFGFYLDVQGKENPERRMKTKTKTKRISISETKAVIWIYCLLCLFAACACNLASASAAEFKGADGAFTIDLPTGFKPMDPRLVDAMVDLYSQDAGPVTRYGFMPTLSDTVTNPPYLVVEVRNTFRLPDRMVAAQSDPVFLKNSFTQILEKQGVLERNIIDIGYDSVQHRVHFSYTQVPPLAGLTEKNRISKWVTFTEKGSISVTVVCPNQDWGQWSNVLDRAVGSMQIDKDLQYHSHTADLAANHAMDTRNSLTFMALSLAAGIGYLIYKRKCDTVMSDEI